MEKHNYLGEGEINNQTLNMLSLQYFQLNLCSNRLVNNVPYFCLSRIPMLLGLWNVFTTDLLPDSD